MSNEKTSTRNLQLALHHARLIQDRKDVELEILEAIEELIDFPTDSKSSSAAPSQADVWRFRRLVQPFQMSDYDSLIEERTTVRKCGYVFCPKPLKQDKKGTGSYSRILWAASKGSELKVVPSDKYDVWCDIRCAKRAMYIKMQLSEVPAWERKGGGRARQEIEVMYGDDQTGLMKKMQELAIGNNRAASEDEMSRALSDLALERGSQNLGANMDSNMVSDIRENPSSHHDDKEDDYMDTSDRETPPYAQVEGYLPKTQARNILHLNQDD